MFGPGLEVNSECIRASQLLLQLRIRFTKVVEVNQTLLSLKFRWNENYYRKYQEER